MVSVHTWHGFGTRTIRHDTILYSLAVDCWSLKWVKDIISISYMCRISLTLACNWLPSGCPSLWIFDWRTFLQLAGQVHECDFDTNVSGSPLATHESELPCWGGASKGRAARRKACGIGNCLIVLQGWFEIPVLIEDSPCFFRKKRIAQFQSESCWPFAKKMSFIARFSALSLHFSLFAYVMTGWYTH